ncbi:porin [Vibrio parahaemolyticus]|uniref:porin n=1 Tax=Vibrio parahaemolyticus TaxID=670 RepID=UPI0003FA7875|nr:porin [Vibrio parahaemolyticus]
MKTIKKTATISTMALALSLPSIANAMQIGGPEDYNLELYGNIAFSIFTTNANEKIYDYNHDNESYIGFRGSKEIIDGVDVLFQIESGYVGYEASMSGLGTFDTFVGFRTDNGTLRFGRMKSALYELVDWPYTNPGLGRVFDWGGDVKWHQSNRMSNMIRYDASAKNTGIGDFDVVLSVNRDDTAKSGSHAYSSRITYTPFAQFKIHGAYEQTDSMRVEDGSGDSRYADTSGYIVGIETPLWDTGLKLYAGYKNGENVDQQTNEKHTQDAISIIGEYWHGIYGAKLGYAKNFDYEINGIKQADSQDEVYSLQLMANMDNGFLPYVRVGYTDAYNAEDKDMFYRIGLEFWF